MVQQNKKFAQSEAVFHKSCGNLQMFLKKDLSEGKSEYVPFMTKAQKIVKCTHLLDERWDDSIEGQRNVDGWPQQQL